MHEHAYARAQQIVHEVLELPAEERVAAIAFRCSHDAALAAEVRWLIEAIDDDALDAIPDAVSAAAHHIAGEWSLAATNPGNYRLLRPIGEGGMGVVWLAERHTGGARQTVALKRLHPGALAQRARLLAEQRILATLTHSNIARLLDAGEDRDGAPFLAMEYVDGERIDHWCFARQLDARSRIGLFIKTCAAVSYAHQLLVIHRDLKPSNILVDRDGEPKLLDFGIARLIDAEATQHTATRAMTPAYASPEQLEGRPLSTATDVWSLGVMLYELLAGVRPLQHFDDAHAQALKVWTGGGGAGAAEQADAASLRTSTAALHALPIPADIDAIVRKALRREPELRYGSVRELAEDLERFLAARPVLARRGQWSYRARRFAQRNRWPIAAGLVALTLATAFTWRTTLAERAAREQAQLAERTTEFLISTFALSDPTQAGRHDYSAREVLDRGRERVEQELADAPRVRARMLEALGNAYRGINEGSSGAVLLEAAAQLNLDPEVADPAAAARSLRAKSASILASNGSTQAAEEAAQRAFELVRRHAGQDALRMAEAHGALAAALDGVGKESAAISAARTALTLREAGHAGPLQIAQSHIDLCHVLSGAGAHGAALEHCERGLSLYESGGAVSSNDYRLALRQLERTLVYSGGYARGLRIARQRLALTARLFGEHSSVLAAERLALTDRLAEAGLFEEANAMLALGMPVILERNGAGSSQYAKALFHAGWLNYLQGRFSAALPLMRHALRIHQDLVDGRDRGMLQVLRTTLAQVLIESGQADSEAHALLVDVIAERSQGDAHPIGLAYARLPLAQWHAARGDARAALALLDQVDAVGPGVEREVHARAAATRAAILSAQSDTAGAATQAKSAYELMLLDRGRSNPRTVRYALAYARMLEARGELSGARTLQAEYRPRLLRSYPPDSVFRTPSP